MRGLHVARLQLRSLLARRRLNRELEEELAGDPASREAGSVTVREACREQRGWSGLEHLLQDLRRALRRLRRAPGFTLTAVGALAFGMAAATAIFSLCDAVLLRPLPGIADGRGLVHLERIEGGELLGDFSFADYLDYASQSRAYTALAATSNLQMDVSFAAATDTFNIEAVGASYFAALDVRAGKGRMIGAGDEISGANRVAVVSNRFWREHMNADPRAVGSTIEGNHTALTVVGVAPPGFLGSSQDWAADLFVPITTQPFLLPFGGPENCLTSRFCGWITIIGRLRPKVALARAQAEADTISARIAAAHPELKPRRAVVVAGIGSWSDDRAAHARILETLLFGTFLLMAMTCASLGSLFLARTEARRREMSTQLALGASRSRVLRQPLFEGLWITLAGAGIGAAAAEPLAQGLLHLAPPSVPANLALVFDGRVLACTAALSLVSMAAMGAASALCRPEAVSSRATRPRQRTLLAAQVGMALMLLVAAGLAARTLAAARAGQVPPAAARTELALVDAGHAQYTQAELRAYFGRLHERLGSQPGFRQVALTACLAPAPCNRGPVFVAGTEPPPLAVRAGEFGSGFARPDINWVTPEYFGVFDLPLVAGRGFTQADRADAPLVCVINQRLAARLWPGQAALGRRVAWPQFHNYHGDHAFTVIGIVADRRTQSLLAPPPLAFYVSMAQVPFERMWIAAQTSLAPAAALKVIRQQVGGLDSRIPMINGRTLAEQVRISLWQPIAIASLAGVFGLLAALMAAIGLFGSVAQMVAQRRRELGVRLALGATPRGLVALVLGDGLRPLGLGLLLGAAAAGLATRALRPFLFGVTAFDAAAWLAAAGLLATVAGTAAALAAFRAGRLPPSEALRCE
ncbi:MAG TPA: ABC transporter permease [Terriglobales bacterium]|nr:ABC transporter permease [Terriglobales bacterium]